jgi:hypothetical protein
MIGGFLYQNFALIKTENMKIRIDQNSWGIKSVSFWSVLILALGIIFIGIRFITNPDIGGLGYGIPFKHADDTVYGRIKGIRDLFSGLVLLPMLWMRMRKAVAWVFTVSIVVPAFDFLVILCNNSSSDISHLLIHGITAVVMVTTSILLFYGIRERNKN